MVIEVTGVKLAGPPPCRNDRLIPLKNIFPNQEG